MAKMKYDVSNVESSNFESPQPGTYATKVFSVVDRTEMEGKNDWEVVLEITTEGRFKGSRVWYYLNWGEPSRWKVKEFVEALAMKAKGVLDSDRLVGKEVGVVIVADSWQGEYKGRISKFLPISAIADDDEDDEDVVDDDEVDDDDEGDEEEQDYSSMTLAELRAEAAEREIKLTAKQKKDKDAIIELLEEDDEAADDDEEDEDEPEPPAPKAGKQKIGGKKAADVVAEDEADDEDEDEDEDDGDDDGDEEDDEEQEDYSEWSDTELKEELESRGLPTRGSKKALIARIEKDDASAAKPF